MRMLAVWRSVLAVLILSGSSLFSSAAPATNLENPGCTQWRSATPVDPNAFTDCTLSDPWWTSWSSCAATPVHSELWKASNGSDKGLARVPWMQPTATGASVIAHQYYGNRPLHTGGTFPNGDNAKVLWQFDRPVTGLTLTAIKLDDNSQSPVTIEDASTSPDFATDWPSSIDIPTAGCWQVNLTAKTGDALPVKASVTFIVVQ